MFYVREDSVKCHRYNNDYYNNGKKKNPKELKQIMERSRIGDGGGLGFSPIWPTGKLEGNVSGE